MWADKMNDAARIQELEAIVVRLQNEVQHEGEHQRRCAEEWFTRYITIASALRRLLLVVNMKHGSMCPSNTCTCDLTETLAVAANSAHAVLNRDLNR